ncbi:MAG: P-II family nitrogen regulator [Rhodothermales bacterium]|nr:P-II family nitrogen regulator [Rhodothermales bacterium]MCA0269659.1 P-II family nitrogen regulator [Bacteroidota bacterium]
MKLIKAIIRPEQLGDVLAHLYRADIQGLTITRCDGHGGEHDEVETYRGTTVKVGLQEKVMLDIGVSESFVEACIEAIVAGARTGEVGDGKIFVLPVERVVRIRTGETDTAAVTPVAA